MKPPYNSKPEGSFSLSNWFRLQWQALTDKSRFKKGAPASDIDGGQAKGSIADSQNNASISIEGNDIVQAEGEQSGLQVRIQYPRTLKIRLTVESIDGKEDDGSPEVIIIQPRTGDDSVIVQVSQETNLPSDEELLPIEDQIDIRQEERSLRRRPNSVAFFKRIKLDVVLLILAIALYLGTRLIGLEQFPIYFFTDEAVHTVLAETLVKNDLKYGDQLLPTYFSLGSSYGLNSVSVYLQVIPYVLFGKTVFVTRATSVLVTLLGAIAVGLILKDFFGISYWWVGTLILSITPTWFLHSRTAFENVESAAFYACFLYFYLRYRVKAPRSIYAAVVFGALTFYTHGLGQVLIGITALLLFFTDLRYHWKNRKTLIIALGLVILLALTFIRYTLDNQSVIEDQMRQRGSYWTNEALPVFDKVVEFSSEYLYGLSPFYWYRFDPSRDLVRHHLYGYGHLLLPTLPFLIWGLWITLLRLKDPAHRVVLLALLAAPVGAALVQVTILRMIWYVIPATLIISLGLNQFLIKLENMGLKRRGISVSLFILLGAWNIFMLGDALKNGPTWYQDYGLYGMQYGAKQVFGEAIPDYLQRDENNTVVVSPIWANGTENLKTFFLSETDARRVSLDSIDAYLFERKVVDPKNLLVITEAEYQKAHNNPKVGQLDIEHMLEYPDGTPGFYFVHFDYSQDADKIFAEEAEARKQLVEGMIELLGEQAIIRHSVTDGGQLQDIFDDDFYTLMRGLEANPFIIEIEFSKPVKLIGLGADFGRMDFSLLARLAGLSDDEVQEYQLTMRDVQSDAHAEIEFERGPDMVRKIRLEIQSFSEGERAHIHIREIILR